MPFNKGETLKTQIPRGVREFDFRESFIIDYVEREIEQNFKLWGYEKLQLPLLEHYDTHSRSLSKDILNNSFRIVDRYDGSILMLRLDFTTQVARYVAGLKEKDFPIRVYYKGDIFRYKPPKGDNLYETRQIGVELLGVSQTEADAEVIGVAISSLLKLGIEDFQIDINSIKIFNAIKDILHLSQDQFSRFMEHIKNRQIYGIKEFLYSVNPPKDISNFLISVPKLKGDINLINNLLQTLSGYVQVKESLMELVKIYDILADYNLERFVVFDLGEPREFDYYTGIVFEIFSKRLNKVIGTGGRYDKLISNYDGDIPATGFAFDVFCLFELLKTDPSISPKKDFYIIDTTDDKKTAYKLASKLREKGYTVARDIISRDTESSKEVAFKKGYQYVVIIRVENNEKKLYIFSQDGRLEIKSLEEVLG